MKIKHVLLFEVFNTLVHIALGTLPELLEDENKNQIKEVVTRYVDLPYAQTLWISFGVLTIIALVLIFFLFRKDRSKDTAQDSGSRIHIEHYHAGGSDPATQKPAPTNPTPEPPKPDPKPIPTAEVRPHYFEHIPLTHVEAGKLVGRAQSKRWLTQQWKSKTVKLTEVVAGGGVGKTTLLRHWLDDCTTKANGPERIFGWSFYSQGASDHQQSSAEPFFTAIYQWLGLGAVPTNSEAKTNTLVRALCQTPTLLALDGVEPLQHSTEVEVLQGTLKDTALRDLLEALAYAPAFMGLVALTTRVPLIGVVDPKGEGARFTYKKLYHLDEADSIQLLRNLGLPYDEVRHPEFVAVHQELKGHALSITLLGELVLRYYEGDLRKRDRVTPPLKSRIKQGKHAETVLLM